MFDVEDIRIIEEDEEATPMQVSLSLQRAINQGLWSLQGSYGRAMMDAIREGRCLCGPAPGRDYWGNVIPSRSQCEEGTMGTRGFVAARMGEEWAAAMESA